jgi:hypothetical protein
LYWLVVGCVGQVHCSDFSDAFKSNQRKTDWETESCFRTRAEEIGRLTVGFVGSEWGINHTSDAVAKILISRGRNGPHNSQTSAAISGVVPRLKELSCLRARAKGGTEWARQSQTSDVVSGALPKGAVIFLSQRRIVVSQSRSRRGDEMGRHSQTSAAVSGAVLRKDSFSVSKDCLVSEQEPKGERNGPHNSRTSAAISGAVPRTVIFSVSKKGCRVSAQEPKGGRNGPDTAKHPLPSPEPCQEKTPINVINQECFTLVFPSCFFTKSFTNFLTPTFGVSSPEP